jgi:hypothetical protein
MLELRIRIDKIISWLAVSAATLFVSSFSTATAQVPLALPISIAENGTGTAAATNPSTPSSYGFTGGSGGTKFGLQFTTVSGALQNQQSLRQTMIFEHDFYKAFTLSYNRTDTSASASPGAHQTSNVLHLAFSPTHTGFMLDGTTTRTLTAMGTTDNDLLVNVAQHFAALNLTSQFESSENASGSSAPSNWQSTKYGLSDKLAQGLTFSGFWTKKIVQNSPGTDDFDAIAKDTEERYLELSAEYARCDATSSTPGTRQTLTAKILPGAISPLGANTLTLAISNQQVQLLNGLQTASAEVDGIIRPSNRFDFGLSGSKYYLTSAVASSSVPGSRRSSHEARTLRLVSGPSGKYGLNWTISSEQRFDQNGQATRTASVYDAKYPLNSRLALGITDEDGTLQSDGSYVDQDQKGISLTWNSSTTRQLIAQYMHTRSTACDIAGENSCTISCAGPMLGSPNASFGLGESSKADPTGADAFGATADVVYGLKSSDGNQVNITSKLTDWQNQGFGGSDTPSVEETGQLNFQTTF